MDLEEVQSKMPLCNNEIITLKNLHNESRLIQSEEDASVIINAVTDCTLKFKLCAESVSLENVRNSTIVFLPVKSSILIRNCENLNLVVAAQQIRIHDSSNLKLYVHVRGAIIIENCSDVKVAPYHINDCTSQTVLPNDIENPTFWANVQDFNWLAFHEQSPNWKKMDETEWKTFDLNIECASRGIGRGIALQLAEAGATVYITGRKPNDSDAAKERSLPSLEKTAEEIENRGGKAILIYCDHSNSDDVKSLFDQIEHETDGTLDILVNNAFSGAKAISEAGGKKFFECDPLLWDDINNVGLRNTYICSVYAARMMERKKRGLIANISSAGGLQYFFNVAYGVGKAATDRMAVDMAIELKPLGITVISLWPGFVQTEYGEIMVKKGAVTKATGLSQELIEKSMLVSESPEFVGRAIVSIASDSKLLKKTGKIHFTTDLANEYRFKDLDGHMPPSMRSVKVALEYFGWAKLASFTPSCIKIPKWMLHFVSYKF
uniref:C-CAP/cofactor C-like domain-containing protein n=1 Tax=Acrobeloides nanus TaxID=290746 RepID=A0A914BZE3_9BILA